jgi:Serine protease Clip domain PPAF-2/Trypsin
MNHKCVPYYLCKEDGNINSDGSLLIDERFDGLMDAPEEACPSLEQCCKKADFVETVDPNICKDGLKPAPTKCGFRNRNGLGGKINSIQNLTLYSQYAEFPWMTAILVERPFGEKMQSVYQAGGSLIHPKVVLTTAHNIAGIDPKKLVARAGEWDTQSENEMCRHADQKVKKVIRHENFTRNNLQNDIVSLSLINDDIYVFT